LIAATLFIVTKEELMTRMTAGLVTVLLALAPASVMAQGSQSGTPTSQDPQTQGTQSQGTQSQGMQGQGMQGQGAQHQATQDLGIVAVDLTPDTRAQLAVPADRGVLVAQIEPGSPASKSGLRVGDVVVAIADQPITSASDVDQALTSNASGGKVNMGVMRKGKQMDVSTRTKAQKAGQKLPKTSQNTQKTQKTQKTQRSSTM
jgi:C-terminal processing protease CtpA/Prc